MAARTRESAHLKNVALQNDDSQQPDVEDIPGNALSNLETEVIDLFVSGVRLLGIPKSIGEIYGLLFISAEPLSLDAIIAKLKMSKGSGSQGLKFLRNLGAVKPVYVAGQRKDHFEAVAELKPLASGFIREELQPHLESGEFRLEKLRSMAGTTDGKEVDVFFSERIERLATWHKRAGKVLPILRKLLG